MRGAQYRNHKRRRVLTRKRPKAPKSRMLRGEGKTPCRAKGCEGSPGEERWAEAQSEERVYPAPTLPLMGTYRHARMTMGTKKPMKVKMLGAS